jgi:hypothetical protein
MGKISIFNYEMFYLDYLEGRLGEEDIRMLMEFLKEHPECELEDPELPTLSVDEDYVFKGKANLKQTDDNEAITFANIEHFMISDGEGIISDDKRAELNRVIAGNPQLEEERKRYGAVYFVPDETSVYQNKGGLKRRKVIVLWPYISFAAAASVIAFVFLMNGNGSEIGYFDSPEYAGYKEIEVPVKLTPDTLDKNNGIFDEKNPVDIYQALIENSIDGPKRVQPKDEDDNIIPLKPMDSRQIKVAFEPLKPISDGLTPTPMVFENDNVPTTVPVIAMKNPIQPLTSFVTKKTNTTVDMGTRKKAEGKKGGFFFKVGKFEISKNKH